MRGRVDSKTRAVATSSAAVVLVGLAWTSGAARPTDATRVGTVRADVAHDVSAPLAYIDPETAAA